MKTQASFFKKSICSLLALMLFVGVAFATPTALTTLVLKINNYQVSAGDLLLTFTACDNVNGNSFVPTGQEVLLVFNSAGGAGTFTMTPVADPFGGTNTTLTAYSVAAGAYAAVQVKQVQGFVSGGIINLACSASTMKFAVIHYN